MTTSYDDLVAAFEAGERPELVLFYGHRPEPDGSVGLGCLSQWWPAPFEVDGRRFATAEHWMMWCKARLFGDADAASRVLLEDDPAVAKKVGRSVRDFEKDAWTAESSRVVVEGNLAKFAAHPPLRDVLVGTGDAVLVEAAPRDVIWGIGLGAANPKAQDPRTWRGRNRLGFALMRVRERLR
ncbi:NADAR family protein [Lapillicoccus jejuensis]|uniref:NADAR domain-containing protein n=1 Tax=Lapillicoccus jejuensis TaxID=402171 RepID=A0A542DX21_9MICO|nr:NADAR family protein [Lapillicoccus jejuensis]TQJ07628.1 hypothetical protein FB458_0696 [Lapillicoccus jejuensis]